MNKIREIRGSLEEAAFFVGNGINLYAGIMQSWEDLLSELSHTKIEGEGLTNTEIYDLIELSAPNHSNLKEKVVDGLVLKGSENLNPHRKLVNYASLTKTPILTTNFDLALENSVGAEKYRTSKTGFTHYYPWRTYYGFEQFSNPISNFGIWHVHGSTEYSDSIRLGLSDYMGSVEHASKFVHGNDERSLSGKRTRNWDGKDTWLHIWFNTPLIIFGLGYGADEVFLRWLLIERKKYLQGRDRDMKVWYLKKGDIDLGTANLMKNLNVTLCEVDDYNSIYG